MKRSLFLLLLELICIQYGSMQSQESDGERVSPEVILDLIDCVKSGISNLTDIVMETRDELRVIREKLNMTETTTSTKEEAPTHALVQSPEPSITKALALPAEASSPAPPAHPCGGNGKWRTVRYYNFSDESYNCPAGWQLTRPPARGCGRVTHGGHSCDSVTFPVYGGPYSRICGLVLGYQFGKTFAFHGSTQYSINGSYVTGVSITRGNPRQHVWTYAVGEHEHSEPYVHGQIFCPCERVTNYVLIPQFVGTSWYCESGDNTRYGTPGYNLFYDDVLWDGEGCRDPGRCCQFDGPLYFTVALPHLVVDPIEFRICNHRNAHFSNVIISQLELYVQ